MSTRAEIRHLHLVEGVPKKEVARRLGVDVKTVRRHVGGGDEYPARRSPRRPQTLDPHRVEIEKLIEESPKISAKRIGRLLEEKHGTRYSPRTVRRGVQKIRGSVRKPEAFVHRTHLPGETMEIDFGESWAVVAGERKKVFFFVATLPASNAYFAKAYFLQRVECLLDGITSAIEWFGGLPKRVVFDNAKTAVTKILGGTERVENELFQAYRSEWPLGAEFCNPASGWEKGSVERGVEYVRGAALRPIPEVEDLEELNAKMLLELELDLDRRRLRDGRSCREALEEERKALRPIPEHRPSTARVSSCTVDKHGHVRIDRSTYSVPWELARTTVTAHLFHDRVEIASGAEVVARHRRSLVSGRYVLELVHCSKLLEMKPRAAYEATVIRQMCLPDCFDELYDALRESRSRPHFEWVKVVGLLAGHPVSELCQAIESALASHAPGFASIQQLLRRDEEPKRVVPLVDVRRSELAAMEIPPADLESYGVLCGEVVA